MLAVLALSILTAGVASATEWKDKEKNKEVKNKEWKNKEWKGNKEWQGKGWGKHSGKRGKTCPTWGRVGSNRAVALELPQEILEKWAEAKKTAIDLKVELRKNPVNREKALELHGKRRALMQEISDWHFNQKLDALIPVD